MQLHDYQIYLYTIMNVVKKNLIR